MAVPLPFALLSMMPVAAPSEPLLLSFLLFQLLMLLLEQHLLLAVCGSTLVMCHNRYLSIPVFHALAFFAAPFYNLSRHGHHFGVLHAGIIVPADVDRSPR